MSAPLTIARTPGSSTLVTWAIEGDDPKPGDIIRVLRAELPRLGGPLARVRLVIEQPHRGRDAARFNLPTMFEVGLWRQGLGAELTTTPRTKGPGRLTIELLAAPAAAATAEASP